MTPEQFCYWLNGFGELSTEPPTAEQWDAIKEHLALVFTKVTPKAPGDELHAIREAQRAARPIGWPVSPYDLKATCSAR